MPSSTFQIYKKKKTILQTFLFLKIIEIYYNQMITEDDPMLLLNSTEKP